MTPLDLIVDAVLVTMLAMLAWCALSSRALFRAAVLFIAFGLTLALAWARLGAPDLALAEAAVGAGLTGVLLVYVSRAITPRDPTNDEEAG